MKISEFQTSGAFVRAVFKGTKEEVDKDVAEYLKMYPEAGYMTTIRAPQKVAWEEIYQIRVDRLASCD